MSLRDLLLMSSLLGKRSEEKGDAFVRSDDSDMVRTPREREQEEDDYDQDVDGYNPWAFFNLEAQIQNGLL